MAKKISGDKASKLAGEILNLDNNQAWEKYLKGKGLFREAVYKIFKDMRILAASVLSQRETKKKGKAK